MLKEGGGAGGGVVLGNSSSSKTVNSIFMKMIFQRFNNFNPN